MDGGKEEKREERCCLQEGGGVSKKEKRGPCLSAAIPLSFVARSIVHFLSFVRSPLMSALNIDAAVADR